MHICQNFWVNFFFWKPLPHLNLRWYTTPIFLYYISLVFLIEACYHDIGFDWFYKIFFSIFVEKEKKCFSCKLNMTAYVWTLTTCAGGSRYFGLSPAWESSPARETKISHMTKLRIVFLFTAITPCFCCKYFEDFDFAQKCAKQNPMYRGEKINIE